MSFTVERLPQEPILLIHMIAPLNPEEDLAQLYKQTDILAAEIQGTIYRLVDWTQAQLTFDLVSDLLDIQRKSAASTAPRSSRVKSYYVAVSEMEVLIVDSLRQTQYGRLNVMRFSSVEEGLRYIRQQIQP